MFTKVTVKTAGESKRTSWIDLDTMFALEAQYMPSGQLHQITIVTITGTRIAYGLLDGAAEILEAFQKRHERPEQRGE